MDKKTKQLGMKPSMAHGRLDRILLFHLGQQLGWGYCFRCGKEIKSYKDMSIEHKVDWLDNDPNLFWDIDNLAFSHLRCNASFNRIAMQYKARTHKKCNKCEHLLPLKYFGIMNRKRGRAFRSYCNKCRGKFRL